MTVRQKLKILLKENPHLNNNEISKQLGISESTIKTTLWRMQSHDEIIVETKLGKRTVTIIENHNEELIDFKKETYLELAQQLIRASESETNSYELRQNGKLLVRILEKI